MRLPTPCHRSLTRVMRSFLEQCSHARGATQVPGALRGAGTAAPQVHLPAAAPHHRPQHADAAGRLRPPHARRGARAHHRRGRRPPSAPGRCAALPSAAVHCSATVTQRRTVCFASRGYLGRSKGPPYCCQAGSAAVCQCCMPRRVRVCWLSSSSGPICVELEPRRGEHHRPDAGRGQRVRRGLLPPLAAGARVWRTCSGGGYPFLHATHSKRTCLMDANAGRPYPALTVVFRRAVGAMSLASRALQRLPATVNACRVDMLPCVTAAS